MILLVPLNKTINSEALNIEETFIDFNKAHL